MIQNFNSVQAYHRKKQYSAIVGNFNNNSKFKEIGNFYLNDTTGVYKALAKYTRNETEKFFGLKGKKFEVAVEKFKEIYKDYAKLSKTETYQNLVNAIRFGYTLPKNLDSNSVLNAISIKRAENERDFKILRQESKEINNNIHDLDKEVKDRADIFKKQIIKAAEEAKSKRGGTLDLTGFIKNSYFGASVGLMGNAAEILALKSIDENIMQPLGIISDKKITGAMTKKIAGYSYTSKGDISFTLKVKNNSAEAIFGSIKFKKGTSKEFVAVKDTNLKAVPASNKFKTDFTNLFLSININSDSEIKFLTSLIADYALLGVFNRPMYMLKLSANNAEVDFFYEIYESYSSTGSGNRPYIKKSVKYQYQEGNSWYQFSGSDSAEKGRSFYKNVRFEDSRLQKEYPEGYMSQSYAMDKTDITNLIVIGKLIR